MKAKVISLFGFHKFLKLKKHTLQLQKSQTTKNQHFKTKNNI
ncbi:hypothetical protein AsAng_0049460 [Aureispira anguillae]|uniref:Uncharacterized protein n=1 Tax=Aureispira anguillae TaxID=2864201 RepID=A0A915YJB9_9BACT|nr:hypothetical protein AsAng_0049460 [Aureispira anguillae]